MFLFKKGEKDLIDNSFEGERINYSRRELTEQEMELVQMHSQVLFFVYNMMVYHSFAPDADCAL